jgi:dipeptidyl aminopeptidase/acylaminoacyl peptidase
MLPPRELDSVFEMLANYRLSPSRMQVKDAVDSSSSATRRQILLLPTRIYRQANPSDCSRLSFTDSLAIGTTGPMAGSTSAELFQAYSSDGRHIAFACDRTGDYEIWVADADGSNARRLTNGPNHRQFVPKWSPDDRQIAFESVGEDGHSHIWITPADAGPPRQITTAAFDQRGASWSRNGKWVYFAQDNAMGDGTDIWRVPVSGGASEQITRRGTGSRVLESPDGRSILYEVPRRDIDAGSLLIQPLDSSESRIAVPCAQADSFTWTPRGIYYLECADAAVLHLINPRSAVDKVLGRLEHLDLQRPSDLAVAPDGESVLYARRPVQVRGDLWMLEHFR